ncbi:MAG: ABC transporter permease [Nannocystales bacterium]
MPIPTTSSTRARLDQLRDASLPFVTRMFRGHRLRRYMAVSLLLGVLSVLVGAWLSFGSGGFEQDVRRQLDLEQWSGERERAEFTLTVRDGYVYEMLTAERARTLAGHATASGYSRLADAREQGYATLHTALTTPAPPQYVGLEADIRALLERHPSTRYSVDDATWQYGQEARDWQFDWHAPAERQRVRAIIDQQLVPNVELYTSPLSFADGVRLTGAVAGGFVVLLMLIVAPLASGATVAQEVHENTLQPVLGTRLRPVDIVTGFTAAGVALASVLAAPSFLVMLLAGLSAGHTENLVPFLLLLPAASLFLVLFTQLIGFGLGRRWSSGIVATLLTGALCMLMLFSTGIGMGLEDDMVGLIAMMPPVGLVHGLRELFVPHARLSVAETQHALVIISVSVVGLSVLAYVMSRALTRRIEGRTQPSLTRTEGLLAAAVSMVLALAVVPEFDANDAIPAYFVSLGLVAFAWQLIVAGRVPVGDGPSTLRTLPLRGIMVEFAAFVGMHAGLLVLVFGPGAVPLVPMGAFHLLWALVVLALLAVRLVALPTNILGSLFAMICYSAICFEMVCAAVTAAADHGYTPHPFVLFEASPVLGVLQLVLTLAIPLALVRALRKGSASVA